MVNAKIPNFDVNYNTIFGTGFSVGENPAYYPFYEKRIVDGQRNISNQIAGFSGLGSNTGSPQFGNGDVINGGNDTSHWGTGAYLGGTFAPIVGPTVEIGIIIDSHSQTYAYLSLGIAVGAEVSGSGGVIVVPYKSFNGQSWFGDGFGGSINVPGGGFEYSQSMYDTQYRAFKGNLGIGLGGSVNATYTFKIPVISDTWTRPWRHF